MSEPAGASRHGGEEAGLTAEVVVLGSGPGGYTAAFRAADLGKKTVLVERHSTLGGVCLNVGCIPSKALLHAARVMEEAAYFSRHGVDFGAPGIEPRIEVDKLRQWQEGVVARLTRGLSQMAKERRVEVLEGEGRFVGPHAMEVETSQGRLRVSFDHAVIAVGSRPIQLPDLPYEDGRVMDSTDALKLGAVPERLLVVGAGIIGLEMATVYDALGSRVTVVELTPDLIPGCDRDLVRPLKRRIAKRYENLYLKTRVTRIESRPTGLEVSFDGEKAPRTDLFQAVLVAVGRRPNGKLIAAEAAGVEVTDAGFIPVDSEQRTNVPHVFAIGDVVGEPMLAHKASHEGKVAAEVIAGLKSASDAKVIPSVAYTDPEIAWVGVREDEARQRKLDFGKGVFPWAASGRSLAMGRDDGLTKVLFDKSSGRVLGGGIVGVGAGELISELALAIEMGSDAFDLALTVHPHPTLSESVGLAAEVFEGTVTDLYLRRK